MPPDAISPAAVISLITEEQIVEAEDGGLTPESDLFAQGMDSLAMMQLLLHLEKRFDVKIEAGEMRRERFATASALAGWLTTLKGEAAA